MGVLYKDRSIETERQHARMPGAHSGTTKFVRCEIESETAGRNANVAIVEAVCNHNRSISEDRQRMWAIELSLSSELTRRATAGEPGSGERFHNTIGSYF